MVVHVEVDHLTYFIGAYNSYVFELISFIFIFNHLVSFLSFLLCFLIGLFRFRLLSLIFLQVFLCLLLFLLDLCWLGLLFSILLSLILGLLLGNVIARSFANKVLARLLRLLCLHLLIFGWRLGLFGSLLILLWFLGLRWLPVFLYLWCFFSLRLGWLLVLFGGFFIFGFGGLELLLFSLLLLF